MFPNSTYNRNRGIFKDKIAGAALPDGAAGQDQSIAKRKYQIPPLGNYLNKVYTKSEWQKWHLRHRSPVLEAEADTTEFSDDLDKTNQDCSPNCKLSCCVITDDESGNGDDETGKGNK